MANLIGRFLFRVVKKWPILLAAFACLGISFGVWLVAEVQDTRFIGVVCIVFYSVMLSGLVWKQRRGTWEEFCDFAVLCLSNEWWAGLATLPCPRCHQIRDSRRWPRPTWKQRIWGGWTCPHCGCDVDFTGKPRDR